MIWRPWAGAVGVAELVVGAGSAGDALAQVMLTAPPLP
jgi:hypothetical protein